MAHPPAEKWYCPCGQANASAFQACVNCGASAGEGMDAPPSVEESLASGRPLAPARSMGVIAKRILERASIHTLPYKVTVTENRIIECALVAILSAFVGFGGWLVENAVKREWHQEPGMMWAIVSASFVFVALGSFIVFPNLQITINGPAKECSIYKRWLMFIYARRTFSLNDYFLTPGIRHTVTVVDKNGGAAVLLAPLGLLGHLLIPYLIRKKKVEENFRTLAVTSGPHGERWELVAFRKGETLDRILEHVREIIPERVLDE
jgi:hypothetical protein